MGISEHTKLDDLDNIRNFMFGGNAEFTLHSLVTDKHFTYKINSHSENPDHPIRFVFFLTGSDNDNDFTYAGTTRRMVNAPDKSVYFKSTAKSPNPNIPAIKAYRWFISQLNKNKLPDTVEFMHTGKCSACGRKLTTPESIRIGLGPVCRSRM